MQIVKLNFIVSALFASGNTTFRSPFLHLILKRMPLCLIFTNSKKWILSNNVITQFPFLTFDLGHPVESLFSQCDHFIFK